MPHTAGFDKHERVEAVLTEAVATFILHEANPNPLITVTRVAISPDYRRATIFFTTIPTDREEDALVFMKRFGGELREYIKKQSRLKFIPHLEFSIDYGERHRQHIDEIAQDLPRESTEREL